MDGRALHISITAKNTAVSRQWAHHGLAFFAFVKELTGVRRHLKLDGMAAFGTCQGRCGLNRVAHLTSRAVEGYPALVVAWAKAATVATSGSKVTVAVFFAKSIWAFATPGVFSKAFLTVTGQSSQVMFFTSRVTVFGVPAKALIEP